MKKLNLDFKFSVDAVLNKKQQYLLLNHSDQCCAASCWLKAVISFDFTQQTDSSKNNF